MKYGIRKMDWGLAPVGEPTMKLFENTETGAVIWFEVESEKKRRSLSQNALMWLWFTEIGKAIGETKDDVYQLVKPHYLLPILVRDDPEVAELMDSIQGVGGPEGDLLEQRFIRSVISSRLLTVKQFTELLNDIERDARIRGIKLTNPEDMYFEALQREAA